VCAYAPEWIKLAISLHEKDTSVNTRSWNQQWIDNYQRIDALVAVLCRRQTARPG